MDLRRLPAIDVMSMVEVGFDVSRGISGLDLTAGLKKPYLLPQVSFLLAEDHFFDVGLGWSEEGIQIFFRIDSPFEEAFFPDVEKGDGVEVFIDTRGVDSAVTIHKYCHHFIFLPKAVDGIQAAEVTRFKSDDRHEPASSENFSVISKFKTNSYEMQITIPEISLFGYNPLQIPKLSFACVIHRSNKAKGHFGQSGIDFKCESCPALWTKLRLV